MKRYEGIKVKLYALTTFLLRKESLLPIGFYLAIVVKSKQDAWRGSHLANDGETAVESKIIYLPLVPHFACLAENLPLSFAVVTCL